MNLKPIFIASLAVCSLIILASNVAQAPKSKAKPKPVAKTAAVQKNDTITTKSGLRYVITKKNPKGLKAAKGDKIEAHYTGTLLNGKKFDSSRDRNQPFAFEVGMQQVIAGWDEGFLLLRQGERATLIIPPALGYGDQAMGSDIPANSTLVFDVEIIHVHKPHIAYNGKGKDTVKLTSGLKYIVISKGNASIKAKAGDTADIYYAGFFTDGKRFDGNFEKCNPFVLPVVGAGVIEGWRQMIPLMNKGMKVRVIIPPNLAYGARGYPGAIPPNAILIFDMYLANLH